MATLYVSLMWFVYCTLCGQFPTHSIYYIASTFSIAASIFRESVNLIVNVHPLFNLLALLNSSEWPHYISPYPVKVLSSSNALL